VTKPSFGFSGLADIEPAPATKGNGINLQEAERAAERLGFASRQGLVRRRKRQPVEEPVDQLNLRAAVADINAFVEWCERERLSYREAFSRLVKTLR